MSLLEFFRMSGAIGFCFIVVLGIAMQLTYGFSEREW